MNIYDRLGQDHRQIDELLTRLARPPESADFDHRGRTFLLDRLIEISSRHEAGEEMVFWPQVRKRLPDGPELADTALEQEGEAKAQLDLLRVISTETDLLEGCRRLREAVRQHAAFEEEVVWPKMRKASTRVWALVTAAKFAVARRTGPTRPHPKGPDRPVALATLGAPAVMLDHFKDIVTRRSKLPADPAALSGEPDAVASLTHDHLLVTSLLSQIERQEDPEDGPVNQLVRELAIHDSIERQYLYPIVRRRLQDGNQVYERLITEHGEIAKLASDIDVYPIHDEARNALISELISKVRVHIEQEEGGVLPALAARLTREELVHLGQLLKRAKGKAPTRPHPHAAGAGTGAKLSRLIARPLDKTRDTVAGRRHS